MPPSRMLFVATVKDLRENQQGKASLGWISFHLLQRTAMMRDAVLGRFTWPPWSPPANVDCRNAFVNGNRSAELRLDQFTGSIPASVEDYMAGAGAQDETARTSVQFVHGP